MGKRKFGIGPDLMWEEVTIEKERSTAKGHPRVTCNWSFTGGVSRIKAHFLGNENNVSPCSDCRPDLLNRLTAETLRKDAAAKRKRTLDKLDKTTAAGDGAAGSSAQPARTASSSQPTVAALFSKNSKAEADAAVARFAYATGTPFNVFTHSSFQLMCREVGRFGAAYKPPNINQLREELLDKEYSSIQQEASAVFLSKLPQDGCTVSQDGWADIQRRALLNAVVANNKGAMFLHATDTKGESKVRLLCLC